MTDTLLLAGTIVLETTDPAPVDWSRAALWRVIVTLRGVPCAALWIPGPGRLRDPDGFTEQLLSPGRSRMAYEAFEERFRRQLGVPESASARPSCSVIVCTHRRSAYLPGLLAATASLDPAPDELIVVDNDPGDADCRELVEAAGARYVREDRRGLDNARNAGLAAAQGDLVAFTDDDCVPSPGWLRALGELFADDSIAAVTGPAFAYELASPAQLRFEREGGFSRGLVRRWFDWRTISPLGAGVVGAGANMIFRREVLDELGVVFPPELDAGTPTESGGDMYALYKVLAVGRRVLYDPGTWVFHRHRPDPGALHRAFFGYGVGLSATMAKVLVEEREPEALAAWWWLVAQYRTAQRRRLLGYADAYHVRVAWDYLRGGLAGPRALVRARVRQDAGQATPTARPDRPQRRAAPAARAAGVDGSPGETPAISVIVPTAGRAAALARCVGALARQDGRPSFEVIVVDDGQHARIDRATLPQEMTVSVVRSGGRGAAAARNAGAGAARAALLLFLDDDLVPARDLVGRHLAGHRGRTDRVVVGCCPPRPPGRTLTELAASLWWQDRYREMASSAALTFTDMLSGNMSVSRQRFLELGGFDERLGRLRREDWLWGIHALQAGLTVEYDSQALAAHEFSLSAERRLEAAFAEGRGDAHLEGDHPTLAAALPVVQPSTGRGCSRLLIGWALRRGRSRRCVIGLLEAVERVRLRGLWLRLFAAAQTVEYARGRRNAEAGRGHAAGVARLLVDVDGDRALPRPGVCAPRVRVLGARHGIDVIPEAGRWNAGVAASLAAAAVAVETRAGAAGRPRSRPARLLTVLVGPGHTGEPRRRLLALRDEGVEVLCGDGAAATHWAVIDRLIRESTTELVATVVPRVRCDARWVDAVAASLDGDRVAVLTGDSAHPAGVNGDPWLTSRFDVRPRYPMTGRPLAYVAFRRAHYVELGGVDRATMRFGDYAPVLELAERALDRGLVVVQRDLVGLSRQRGGSPVHRAEWQRQRARGALLVRGGPTAEGGRLLAAARGAAPLALDVARTQWHGPRAIASLVAYACGMAEGAMRRPARHAPARPATHGLASARGGTRA